MILEAIQVKGMPQLRGAFARGEGQTIFDILE